MRTLHRICRVYAALGVVVPVFGLATATSLGVLADAWLLDLDRADRRRRRGLLGLLLLPGQAPACSAGAPDRPARHAHRHLQPALGHRRGADDRPPRLHHGRLMRLLRIAAVVEFATLAALLVNLVTVHWAPVASLLGPIHGCAYLAVIGATWQLTKNRTNRLLALLPGIGGLLVRDRSRASPPPGRAL